VPTASENAVREARDMRERRDVDRVDSHLLLPVQPIALFPLVARAAIVFPQPVRIRTDE